MFIETFEKIRENFRAMFTEVFGGGKADLILSDQNDVLGKRHRNHGAPAGQTTAKHLAAVRRGADDDRCGAVILDLSGPAQSVLFAG